MTNRSEPRRDLRALCDGAFGVEFRRGIGAAIAVKMMATGLRSIFPVLGPA